jgi:hypothetical protein
MAKREVHDPTRRRKTALVHLVVVATSFDQGEVFARIHLSILAVQPLDLLASTRSRRSRLGSANGASCPTRAE